MEQHQVVIYQYNNPEELIHEMVTELTQRIKDILSQKHQFDIALSGGKSPLPLFHKLSQAPDISWEKGIVHLIDERWVPKTSDDSNEKLISSEFIAKTQPAPRFKGLYNPSLDCRSAMEKLSACPPELDIGVLGMGLDGHTASIFPDSEEFSHLLETSQHYSCCHPQNAPHQRATTTLKGLTEIKHLYLYIPGKDKMEKFRDIQNNLSLVSPLQALTKIRPTPLYVFTCN